MTPELVTRCLWCAWTATGTLAECREAHRAHREREHGAEIEAFCAAAEGRAPGDAEGKPVPAMVARIVGLLRVRGEMPTPEIAEALGVGGVAAGIACSWAARRGKVEKRDDSGLRLWRTAGTEPTRTI